MKHILMITLAVLALASTARADVWYSRESYTSPASGYVAVTIALHTDDGALIAAIDLDAANGRGILGPMNQVLAAGSFPTPDETYKAFVSPEEWAMDSHFLVNASDDLILVGGSLQETSHSLNLIAGIPAADWSESFTLAYIVAPIETRLDIYMRAEISDSNQKKSFIDFVYFPEPASLSLLALGSLFLARRTRACR